MKYLKRFLESRFQSEEDVSNHLLELLDEEFLSLYGLAFKNVYDSSGNIVIGSNILYAYKISDKFKRIKNLEELEKYTSKLSELYRIIKRWNLNFSIIQDEIVIIDESPDYISEFVIKNPHLPFYYTHSGQRTSGWEMIRDKHNGDIGISNYFNSNLEFFIVVKGKKKDVENYFTNRLVYGEKYQLKLKRESQGEVEYQIIPK